MKNELLAYLEQEKANVNTKFPQYEATTLELFQQLHAFFVIDYTGLTDNRVYRCFLSFFKEIICYVFGAGVTKPYLRFIFKCLNNENVIKHLGSYAKSREADIRFDMHKFLDYFVMTWQGYNDDKQRVMEEIIRFIDNRM